MKKLRQIIENNKDNSVHLLPDEHRIVYASKHGTISSSIDHNKKIMKIQRSSLNYDAPLKQGHGSKLYKAMADHAQNIGYDLHSDDMTNKDAANCWNSLKRKGYNVETHPSAREDHRGSWNGYPNFLIKNNKG